MRSGHDVFVQKTKTAAIITKTLPSASLRLKNHTARTFATNAYLENYEYIEGVIAQKDRLQMEKIEIMMRVDLRSMINNGILQAMWMQRLTQLKVNLEK